MVPVAKLELNYVSYCGGKDVGNEDVLLAADNDRNQAVACCSGYEDVSCEVPSDAG